MDQNACSSPHLIIWQGKKKGHNQISKAFWNSLYKLVKKV